MGKKTDNKGALLEQAQEMGQKAAQEFEKIVLPDTEAMKLALEQPELIGLIEAESLSDTELRNISTDPRLAQTQMESLEGIKELAREGMSAEDRARLAQIQREVAGASEARDKAILQSMFARGVGGSGAELATRLQSSQAATNRAAQAGQQLAADAAAARRAALMQSGQMAGQMEQADYARQAQLSAARDAINKYNTMNKQNVAQQNLSSQQQISNSAVNLKNQQQQYNKQLAQQQFANEMKKASGVASAYSGQANQLMQQANMVQDTPSTFAQVAPLAGAAIGGAAGAYFGGPAGAAAGMQLGQAAGGAAGSMYDGPSQYRYADGGVVGNKKEVTADEIEDLTPTVNAKFEAFKATKKIPMTRMQELANRRMLTPKYKDGGVQCAEKGIIVDGAEDEYFGDRVDAKINKGEMVINLPQQQRLMDIIKGRMRVEELPEESIIREATPMETNIKEEQEDLKARIARLESLLGE